MQTRGAGFTGTSYTATSVLRVEALDEKFRPVDLDFFSLDRVPSRYVEILTPKRLDADVEANLERRDIGAECVRRSRRVAERQVAKGGAWNHIVIIPSGSIIDLMQ